MKARLLGSFDIRIDGTSLGAADLGQRKTQTLLKYMLIHRGKTLTTDQLIEDLYPGSDPEKVLRNLQGRISELRYALEPELAKGIDSQFIERVAKGSYRFTSEERCWLDIEEAESLYRLAKDSYEAEDWNGAIAHSQEFFDLYRGDLLAEDLYEEWTLAPRERFRDLQLNSFSSAAEAHSHLGEYEQAIELTKRLIEQEPALESAYRDLMSYYAYKDKLQSALECFSKCKSSLREHLDVAPSEETIELLARIERGEITAPEHAVPHNLPSPLTSFVGRAFEIEAVADLIGKTRMLTLHGIGGCGKTRLALEVAKRVLSNHEDGIWYVNLSSLKDEALLIQVVTSALGIRESAGGSPQQAVMHHLSNRESLLLLDNCEHLILSVTRFAEELLQCCPNLRIMVTSREALQIDGAISWSVPPLSMPESADPSHEFEAYDGIKLFVERACAAQPDYSFCDEDREIVFQICRDVDALPLAIELAAARMKMLSPIQIAERLGDRFRLLSQESATTEFRQQTLWAMIEWSFKLLDLQGQILLPRLSVFAGGFTLEAVEAVCTDDEIEENEILDILVDLVEKSLIMITERQDTVRYGLLETVRSYAEEVLCNGDERDQLKNSHLEYFSHYAEFVEPDLHGPDQHRWLRKLEREYDNLRSAIQWSLEPNNCSQMLGLRLGSSLKRYWELQGHWSEGRKILNDLIAQAENAPTDQRAKALEAAGFLALRQSDHNVAEKQLVESISLSEELGNQKGVAYPLNYLGSVAWVQGKYEEAMRCYKESLMIFREIEDKLGISMALHGVGLITFGQGNFEEARMKYEESLAIKREIGDSANVALTLNNLGNVAYHLKDFEAAITHHQESLAIRRENGDQGGMARSLNNMGIVLLRQDKIEEARRLFEESLAIREALQDKRGISSTLLSLGNLELALENHEAAHELLKKGLLLKHEVKDKQGMAETLVGISSCCIAEDLYEDAAKLLGAVENLLQMTEAALKPEYQQRFEASQAMLEKRLGEEGLNQLVAEGRFSSLEEVVDLLTQD